MHGMSFIDLKLQQVIINYKLQIITHYSKPVPDTFTTGMYVVL